MKKLFSRQLDNLSDNIPSADADLDGIYARVHNQTGGLQTESMRKRRSLRSHVVLAVIISTTVLGGTAAAYRLARNVSDVFEEAGALNEINSSGETVPLSPDSPLKEIIDKSGTVVDEVIVADGIEVAVRGVVGAGSNIKILVDVEDLSGNPLSLYNDDGTVSTNPLEYRVAKLRSKETLGYETLSEAAKGYRFGGLYDIVLTNPELNWTQPDENLNEFVFISSPNHSMNSQDIKWLRGDESEPHKATLLLNVKLDGKTIEDYMGESLYLTITDIVQMVKLNGTDTEADLVGIIGEFNNCKESDFRKSGGSTNDMVNWKYDYELNRDSGKEIPLTALNSIKDYTVTNAAIRNGVFHLRGRILNYADTGEVPSFSLLNVKTGEYVQGWGSGGDGDADKVARYCASFDGINSPADLADYALILGYGNFSEVAVKGEWEFEIPVNFENLEKSHDINKTFTLGGFDLTADSITVSPYYISLNLSANSQTIAQMKHIENPITTDWNPIAMGINNWDRFVVNESPEVILVMKDGSEVVLAIGTNAVFSGNGFSLDFMTQTVIDPAGIDFVKVGGVVCSY
ncbi:MAG: hypothetical protein FWF82_03325 [Oscillospiraceae bacterium]|nr:hypothetical protein [Oscillospiraceae bacterium]